jgi:hypothetical protein
VLYGLSASAKLKGQNISPSSTKRFAFVPSVLPQSGRRKERKQKEKKQHYMQQIFKQLRFFGYAEEVE